MSDPVEPAAEAEQPAEPQWRPPEAPSGDTSRTLRYFFTLQLFFLAQIFGFSQGQPVLVFLMIAAPLALYLLQGTEHAYKSLLYLVFITLVVGQRTVSLGSPYVHLVPSEVILWLLAVLCMPLRRDAIYHHMPVPLPVLGVAFASLWGVRMAVVNQLEVGQAWGFSKGLFVGIPAFFVCYRLLRRMDQVRTLVTILCFQCLFLSVFTMAEYFDAPFMAYFKPPDNFHAVDIFDFHRAYCAFWGNPMLAGFVAQVYPLAMVQWLHTKAPAEKALMTTVLVFGAYAIFLAGHRGVWVPWIFSMGYFLAQRNRGGGKLWALAIVLFVLAIMPKEGKNRLAGIYSEEQDSSSMERERRARYAWDMIKEQPVIGYGWTASGLVHCEWLQMWADAGPVMLISFWALGYIVQKRLKQMLPNAPPGSEERDYIYGFKASVMTLYLILTSQTFFNLPEQYPLLWLIMAMAFHIPGVLNNEAKIKALAES